MSQRDLTVGPLGGHLVAMAGPAALGMVFTTLYNVVDTFYAGWISTEAQAGLAVSFTVYMILVAVGFGLSSGAGALLGGALGARDPERARKIGAGALCLAAALGVALMILGRFATDPALALLGASEGVADAARSYLAVLFYALPSFLIGFTANGVLSAQGDTRANRNAQACAFFVNVGLNPLLIYGAFGVEGLGFNGIAVSTLISQTGVAVWLVYRAMTSDAMAGASAADFALTARDALDIAKQAAPSSLTMLIMMVGAFIVQDHLQPFGAAAVAGFGVAFRVEQLILLPILSVSFSLMPLVAQNFGAEDFDRVRQAVTLAAVLAIGMSLIGAVALALGGVAMVRVFTGDEAAIASGAAYLRMAALMMPAYASMFLITALLQGVRRPIWSAVIGVYRQNIALLAFPPFFIHTMGWGLAGVWAGLFAAVWSGFALSAVLAIFVCRREIGGLRADFSALRAAA